jgi:hypothetical protein
MWDLGRSLSGEGIMCCIRGIGLVWGVSGDGGNCEGNLGYVHVEAIVGLHG